MKNNTSFFINKIDKVINDNQNYFKELNDIKIKDLQKLKTTILDDLEIAYEKQYFDLNKIFEDLFHPKSKDKTFENLIHT